MLVEPGVAGVSGPQELPEEPVVSGSLGIPGVPGVSDSLLAVVCVFGVTEIPSVSRVSYL